LELGQRIVELLKQPQYSPIPVSLQAAAIYAVNKGFFDSVEPENISTKEKELYRFMAKSKRPLLAKIEKDWNDEIENELKEALEEFIKSN
jgi:F-type H+/Na+-transporting ATPase subunit alpha